MYSRRKNQIRKRMGVISVLVIITMVFAFRYGHHFFGRNQDDATAAIMNFDAVNETNDFEILEVEQEREPAPEREPLPQPKVTTTMPEPTSKPNRRVSELVDEAMALVNGKSGRITEARDRLNETLSMPMNNVQRAVIKRKLSELAEGWLFSKRVFANDRLCSSYQVEAGDLLSAIGRQYKVPWEILAEVNRIRRPELLQAGEIIKVIQGPFHARVYRSTFTMDLYLQNTYVCSFCVGVGRPGRETPTGLWRVKPGGKLVSPTWTDPDTYRTYKADDPDYPLGSRWIALEGISGEAKGRSGFAIHGTKIPEEIGTADSRGCIRLYNSDAILVYNLLMAGLSRVEVVD
jgi:LysM repeat protein